MYGAMLTDSQGVPFYVGGTRPLTLLSKTTYSIPGSSSTNSWNLYQNDGAVRFTFIQSNGSDATKAEWLQLDAGIWKLYATGGTRNVTVYIFGYKTQPVPKWGVAIYNESGECILTNESKVLKDVREFGNPASDSQSGYNIDVSLSGSWAVAPTYTGIFAGVDNSTGQPRPIVIVFYAAAVVSGGNTKITSHTAGSGAGTGGSYANARNTITAIDVSKY